MAIPRADAAFLLRRAGFGGTPAQIDALAAAADWTAAVDRVLDTSANPADVVPPAVDSRDDQWYGAWVAGVWHWMDRMATSPTPLVEKLTLFWHGLFTSSIDKVYPRLVFRQVRTYRAHALGDLHDLAQAMALTPAMLVYLDNETNSVGNPNENFARELMELFLMGRANYTEADVAGMARAWTGHGYDSVGETYVYYPGRHDDGSKTIFGISRTWDGPETITEIVRGSKQAVCARFIADRLWRFLAGPAPSAGTLAALADAFVASGMQIKPLVRAIFLHPDFLAPAARTGLIRSPIEWMAATMKVLGIPASVAHPEWSMDRCGQRMYAPPNVGGWRGQEGWISTSTSWGRGSWASHIRWVARDRGIFAGFQSLTPAQATARALEHFGIVSPIPATRSAIEGYVANEQGAGPGRSWAIQPNLVTLCMLSPDFEMA